MLLSTYNRMEVEYLNIVDIMINLNNEDENSPATEFLQCKFKMYLSYTCKLSETFNVTNLMDLKHRIYVGGNIQLLLQITQVSSPKSIETLLTISLRLTT